MEEHFVFLNAEVYFNRVAEKKKQHIELIVTQIL